MAGKAGKKAAAKKSPARGASASQRDRLEKELKDLLGRIDAEGLIFLIQQAQVLLHNLQVERLNREIEELQRDGAGPAETAAAGRPAARPAVSIEEDPAGQFFHLEVGGQRSTLTTAEMREIVRFCYEPETKSEALQALYLWFTRERKDILLNAGIRAPQHPFFQALFDAARQRFRLKDR